MASIAKLYLYGCESCPEKWSKYPHLDEDKVGLEAGASQDHIVQRYAFRGGRRTTSSITINNPAMRDILRASLGPYPDFDPELEEWNFTEPFRSLVYCWDGLKRICDHADKKSSIKEPAIQLMDLPWEILSKTLKILQKIHNTGAVAFNDLWHIFKPGDLALTTFNDVEAVGRVKDCVQNGWSEVTQWRIKLEYLDCNGERCGYTTTNATIPKFQGNRRVTSLSVYPLAFLPVSATIRDRFTKHGRRFERLRGYHFQTCEEGRVNRENTMQAVPQRVIIDAYAYYVTNNRGKPKSSLDRGENSEDPTKSHMAATRFSTKPESRVEVLDSLTDEECLLATPWVRGFELKTKKWAKFCVDDLSDVVWNNAAFDNLIIPVEEKKLAWAFVRNKTRNGSSFDDFIEDKGRGMIILMFGPTGVGKTFTAEAIAERAHVPLYSMSAGKLGTNPEAVEASLDRALELCKLWNAMFLLDEADVFLGCHTNSDLARNELVAVFLTKLEYYPGVCFLTTNRMSAIDPAFKSRVDLLLRYTDLTRSARRKVWKNFIDRAGRDKFDLSDADVDRLAEVEMNRREIKNLVKSAVLLGAESWKVEMWVVEMLVKNRMVAEEVFEVM